MVHLPTTGHPWRESIFHPPMPLHTQQQRAIRFHHSNMNIITDSHDIDSIFITNHMVIWLSGTPHQVCGVMGGRGRKQAQESVPWVEHIAQTRTTWGISEIGVPYWGPYDKGILLFGGLY